MNKLDQLPFELLSQILDHVQKRDLLTCTLVNRRFHKAALPLLWRELDITSDKALDKIITILSTSSSTPGHHVRLLFIVNCQTMSDTHLLAIIEHVPYLEQLDIPAACRFSDTSLQRVPGYCPHLTSVDLHCQSERGLEITNASMLALGQHCHQLTHLTLSNMASLDYATLLDHLHGCPLTYIRIVPTGVKPSARQPFAESASLGLYRHHQHTLTSLHIGSAGDDIVAIINEHQLVWPHLTSFYVTGCDKLTDAMATTFMQAHPQLQDLGILGSRYLTDQYLDNVTHCLPDLLSLDVACNPQLTASGICRLIRHYNGQLVDNVECEGCDIYPHDDDFPEEMADGYGYRLTWEDYDDPEVVWFCANAYTLF